MNENTREKIDDLKKVAGGTDSGIDSGSGQDPSSPDSPKKPGFGDGSGGPGFGTTDKPTTTSGK